MGQAFKIPHDNSFIDNLILGFYSKADYKEAAANTLFILPNKIAVKLAYEACNKYCDSERIIPDLTTLTECQSSSDPFLQFKELLELPEHIEFHDLKLLTLELFLNWQKQLSSNDLFSDNIDEYKQNLDAEDFCNSFSNFYLNLEESGINIEEFITKIHPNNFPIAEKLNLEFLKYFEYKYKQYKKSECKISYIEKSNFIIKLKNKLLSQLKYKYIVFAGTTGINKHTENFSREILNIPNGIFIYHEALPDYSEPNFAINRLVENLQINNAEYWHKLDIADNKQTYFETKNLNEEAEFIANKLVDTKDKVTVITNNSTLRNLILFKTAKYSKDLNENLDNFSKILQLFKILLSKKHHSQASSLAKLYFSIEIDTPDISYLDTGALLNFIAKTLPHDLDPEISKLKNLIPKIQQLANNNSIQFFKILDFVSQTPKLLFYEDEELLIIHPKDIRLTNPNNAIIADLNHNSWQAKIDKIFHSKIIKDNFFDLVALRESQIANDFLRQLSNSNLTLIRSLFSNSKQNQPYLQLTKYQHLNSLTAEAYSSLNAYNSSQDNSEPLRVSIPSKYKQHDFYATEVEKLMRNPYSIYALKVLKLRKQNHFIKEDESRIFGVACHKILDLYLRNLNVIEISESYNYLVNNFKAEIGKFNLRNSLQLAWINRFHYIAEKFITLNNAEKILSEHKLEANLKNSNIKLKAKLDRIEVTNDEVTIIDYKTGTKPSDVEIKYGLATQLIIEHILAKEIFKAKHYNLEYWLLKGKKTLAIELKSLEHLDIEQISKTMEEKLPEIISDYQSEKIPIIAFPNENIISSYDDYFHLARKNKI